MMTPLQDKKRSISRLHKIASVLVILFLILICIYTPISTVIGRVLRPVLSPVLGARNTVSNIAIDSVEHLHSKAYFIAENKSLQAQLDEARIRLLDRNQLFTENELLKKELGRTDAKSLVLGVVTASESTSVYGTIIADIGTHSGISVGNKVSAFGAVPIGTVTSAEGSTSLITLYSAPGSEFKAVHAPSGVTVVFHGRGGGGFTAEIPQGITVTQGDAFIIPSESTYPVAFAVRSVSDPRDPFQTVHAVSPINVATLHFVTIKK